MGTGRDLGTPSTTVSGILTQDLGLKRAVAKSILRLLPPEQKEHRAAVADDAGRTACGPKGPTLKGTEGSLSCIQGFLHLASSSVNVSVLCTVGPAAFWTGPISTDTHKHNL